MNDRYSRARQNGYRAGLAGESDLIGASDAAYRRAWIAGYQQGAAERKRARTDYAAIRGSGYRAGWHGTPRLYGAHDERALREWYAGYDEGAQQRALQHTRLPRTDALSQVFGGRIRVIP